MMPETARLQFRQYSLDDLETIVPWFTDTEMMRFYGGVRPREDVEQWLRDRILPAWEELGYGYYVLILKETGETVGHSGLMHQDVDGTDELEVGYLLQRDYWGRGLATEAAGFFYDYALNSLGRDRIISIIHPDNAASIRVAEKNGLTLEKTTIWREDPAAIYSRHQ